MSTEECKALAQGYFEKLINAHNLAAVDELFDPNIDFHDPGVPGGTAHGLKAVSLFFATFFAAFPDVHFTIEELFAEGDKVSARFTWRGTHRDKIAGDCSDAQGGDCAWNRHLPYSERQDCGSACLCGLTPFRKADDRTASVRIGDYQEKQCYVASGSAHDNYQD